MGARFRSWWQSVRKPLEIFVVIVGCILVIALLVAIALAYIFSVNVPGFRGKTLWDWLQLLIVPLVLAFIALVFQRANSRTEQQIALDKQREDLLQVYLDRMAELLLKEKLRSSAVDAEVRNVARVRTITVLAQLNGRRIGHVFTFLREAGLVSTTSNDNVVDLRGADLGTVNWSHANMGGAYLPEAYMPGANLSDTDLSEANLSEAYLREADLSKAFLCGINLCGAGLSGANFSGANLTDANLSGAFLDGANFSGATLIGAKLSGTKVDLEQLKQAKSLKGATMPDGSKLP
jgi:uncharacterized protein YjbI with pentapeptide repeats